MREIDRFLAPLLAAGLLAATPGASGAQLRPLEPVDWSVVDGSGWSARVGSALYSRQRASLAGTEGQLWEVGTFTVAVDLGRVALQASGTALRIFRDETVFADPLTGTRAPDGRRRYDTGDYRVSTLVDLVSGAGPFQALVRFGARLPTTDNREGLERDRTDFFSTLAGRWISGSLTVSGEAGIGILGTRDSDKEQVDPVLYGLTARYRLGPVTPTLEIVGQHDTRRGSALRGTEDLSELRVGVRTGGDRWVQATLVRGLTDFSPAYGLTIEVGF